MKRNSNKLPKDILNAAAQITSRDADIQIPAYVHKEYIAYLGCTPYTKITL